MNLLRTLPPAKSKSQKRVGRGTGSGVGNHTVGRGQKGQRTRGKIPLWFEGGQLPLIKRLPMIRGKYRLNSLQVIEVLSLPTLAKLNEPVISAEVLAKHKLIRHAGLKVKIIAGHPAEVFSTPLTIHQLPISKGAKAQVEKAGGKVE